MYEKLKEINQTWRTFFTRFYMTDFSTFIMWSIFHSTFFLHISHVEKFLHMTDFLHLSHVEKFSTWQIFPTFVMWRNFPMWQSFPTFIMWRNFPLDNMSWGEFLHMNNFSPQTPSVTSVTNIRYAWKWGYWFFQDIPEYIGWFFWYTRWMNVKEMLGIMSFMAMSKEDKGCQAESLKECQIRQFLERTNQSCSCFPWALKDLAQVVFPTI